jgi:hypothetical protein
MSGSPGAVKPALLINSRSAEEVMGMGETALQGQNAGRAPAFQRSGEQAAAARMREFPLVAEDQALMGAE